MIHDQQLLREFHELPPESQNELVDFLRSLKQKQQAVSQSIEQETQEQRRQRLQLAAELLLQWQHEPLAEEEQALWDKLEQEGIPGTVCGEPSLNKAK